MVRHVVMFRWVDGVSAEGIEAVTEGLTTMPAAIAEIVEYRFGPDVGINDGNWDYVVNADFETVADYVTYRDHPAHRALIAERIAPLVAERAAVQFELDG